MPGDEANKIVPTTPPPIVEELAAMMTKVMARLDRLDVLDDV